MPLIEHDVWQIMDKEEIASAFNSNFVDVGHSLVINLKLCPMRMLPNIYRS